MPAYWHTLSAQRLRVVHKPSFHTLRSRTFGQQFSCEGAYLPGRLLVLFDRVRCYLTLKLPKINETYTTPFPGTPQAAPDDWAGTIKR